MNVLLPGESRRIRGIVLRRDGDRVWVFAGHRTRTVPASAVSPATPNRVADAKITGEFRAVRSLSEGLGPRHRRK